MTHGIIKNWANRFGLTLEEYLDRQKNGLKRCQKCHEWKPINDFPKDKSRYDGLSVKCHDCIRVKEKKTIIITQAMRDALKERNRTNKWHKGIPLSNTHKKILSDLRKIEGINGNGSFYGSNNPNWKGGVTPENLIARNNAAFHKWRKEVFERDHYTCQRCGDKKGGNLHPHHIKKFSDYKKIRYDINNGITLCFGCHAKEHDVPNSYRKRKVARRKNQ